LSVPLTKTLRSGEQDRLVRQVRGALAAIGRRIPWEPTCLVRAVATHNVLARRSVASNLILSVTPSSGIKVDAHAWLEVSGLVITGEDEKARYVPIYTFSNAVSNNAEGEDEPAGSRKRAEPCSPWS